MENIVLSLSDNFLEILISSAIIGGIVALGLIALLIVVVVFSLIYVYHAFAWMTIAKKLKYKSPWLAWIPFACSAMRLQIGGFAWQWIFLILIPFFGWVILIVLLSIATWRIFKQRGFPAWMSLSFPLMFVPRLSVVGKIAYLISIGFVAWGKKGNKRVRKSVTKKVVKRKVKNSRARKR